MTSNQYRELWKGVLGNFTRINKRIRKYSQRKKIQLTEEERNKLSQIQGKMYQVEEELYQLLIPRVGKQVLNEDRK